MFKTRSQFYKPVETEQKPDEVVSVNDWTIGIDFTPYPDGTRAKFEAFCPSVTPYQFLIPKHGYLFKKSHERKGGHIHYEQFWVEIISYKLGRILGVDVPPAFVAQYESKDKGLEYASLIEWYYNYPNDGGCMIFRGGDVLSLLIPEYDRKKGEQHNFESISEFFTGLRPEIEDWKRNWAEMLLFDAIIGNTDRHQENWEVFHCVEDGKRVIGLSPAFDNGTSMGYEVLGANFEKVLARLDSYVANGYHHMKWSLKDAENAGHLELLQKLVVKFPETERYIKNKLSIDISGISAEILRLVDFDIKDIKYRLCKERADFITKLLLFRYDKIRRAFGI